MVSEAKELFNPSSYFFNPYSITNIAVAIYCFLLGIFVLMKKGREGLSLVSFIFPTGVWLFSFGLMYSANSPFAAYLWNKISYALGVCFISVNDYLFSLEVCGMINNKKEKTFLYLGYLVMAIFAVFTVFTDLIVKFPPRRFFWGYYTNTGILHHIFLPIWAGFSLRCIYVLYHAYKKETNILQRNRIKIFLLGNVLGYVAACDYLAAYGMNVYPFGYIFIAIFLTLWVYNFIKYKALGIETVLHKTLLWIVSIGIIVLPVGIAELFIFEKLIVLLPFLFIALFFNIFLFAFAYYYSYLRPKIDYLFGKKEYAYYELLGRISARISTTLEIGEFSVKLLDELNACIGPQKLYLCLFDEHKQTLLLFAERGLSQESCIYKEGREMAPAEDAIVKYLRDQKEILEPSIIPLNRRLRYLKESPYFAFLQKENIDILIPLTMDENVVAVLGLGRKRSLRDYTKKDIKVLNTLGQELGENIYDCLHHKDIVEKERLAEELRLGKEIQEALLPQRVPVTRGLGLSGLMLPAKEIGGDYYDFITLPKEDEVAIVIGDVSGKGVAAGLLMAMAKTAIHTLSQEETVSPKQVLLRTNSVLFQHIRGQKFMTMLYFQYSAKDRSLRYSSAGHEHILIWRKSATYAVGEVEVIMSGGFMLGMLPDIEAYLEDRKLALEPGDKVLLYTDGVTEAENSNGDRFGLEKLKESFKANSSKSSEELIQAIKTEVYAYIGTQPQYDDITLVGMEIKEG